jgi:hypothetical protein
MDGLLFYAALFLAGPIALAGFACYICRGRPVTLGLGGRQARERRALAEIEWQLLADAKATEGTADTETGHSRQIE